MILRHTGLGDPMQCPAGQYQPFEDLNTCLPNGVIWKRGCWIGPEAAWQPFIDDACSYRYTTCSAYCPPGTCANGGVNCIHEAAPAAAPAPAPSPSPSYSAPPPPQQAQAPPPYNPGGKSNTYTVTVTTPDGSTVEIPADMAPGVSDEGVITPAAVRIPNIWDSLDPTKVSQFEYRGRATSLPVWISDNWRNTLAQNAPIDPAAAAAAEANAAAGGGADLLALVAIGAVAWWLRDKKGARR